MQLQLGLFALITAVLTGLVREHVLLVAALVLQQHSVAGHMLGHHAFDHGVGHSVRSITFYSGPTTVLQKEARFGLRRSAKVGSLWSETGFAFQPRSVP